MPTLKNLVDEVVNIENEIKNCHTSIVSKLNSKGVNTSESENLPTLINKINDITLESLGGKRIVTGNLGTIRSYGSNFSQIGVVKNLPFIPSKIIINSTHIYCVLAGSANDSSVINISIDSNFAKSSSQFCIIPCGYGQAHIYIEMVDDITFRIMAGNTISSATYVYMDNVTWLAIE